MRDITTTQMTMLNCGRDENIAQFFEPLDVPIKNIIMGDLDMLTQCLLEEIEHSNNKNKSYTKLENASFETIEKMDAAIAKVKPDNQEVQLQTMYKGLIEAFTRKHNFSYNPFLVAIAYSRIGKYFMLEDTSTELSVGTLHPLIHKKPLTDLVTILPKLSGPESTPETLRQFFTDFASIKYSANFCVTNFCLAIDNYVEAVKVLADNSKLMIGGGDSWTEGYNFWKSLHAYLPMSKTKFKIDNDIGIAKTRLFNYLKQTS